MNLPQLSIVVQGALNVDFPDDDIARLKSWRELNGSAELIFSISQFLGHRHGVLKMIAPTDTDAERVRMRVAAVVDRVVVAEVQESLPPLKFDDKLNNCNKMIGAAQAGLQAATRKYVLRIRSDAYIRNVDRMLEEFETCGGKTTNSISICPWFTLNPLLLERLPYHFSDWFNLGLAEDVRSLFEVNFFSYHDSVYFESHAHSDYANQRERAFRARFSPEQHLTMSYAAGLGYSIPTYLYEPGFERQTLNLLAERFIVSDLDIIGFNMPKYNFLKRSKNIDLLCLQHAEWRLLRDEGLNSFTRMMTPKLRRVRRRLRKDSRRELKRRSPIRYYLFKTFSPLSG